MCWVKLEVGHQVVYGWQEGISGKYSMSMGLRGCTYIEDCIGIVDGTLIPFGNSLGFPAKDQNADLLNDRKRRYGMEAILVCGRSSKLGTDSGQVNWIGAYMCIKRSKTVASINAIIFQTRVFRLILNGWLGCTPPPFPGVVDDVEEEDRRAVRFDDWIVREAEEKVAT